MINRPQNVILLRSEYCGIAVYSQKLLYYTHTHMGRNMVSSPSKVAFFVGPCDYGETYIMWLKQCHKPPIWEWFSPPIYCDLGDGLLLF